MVSLLDIIIFIGFGLVIAAIVVTVIELCCRQVRIGRLPFQSIANPISVDILTCCRLNSSYHASSIGCSPGVRWLCSALGPANLTDLGAVSEMDFAAVDGGCFVAACAS